VDWAFHEWKIFFHRFFHSASLRLFFCFASTKSDSIFCGKCHNELVMIWTYKTFLFMSKIRFSSLLNYREIELICYHWQSIVPASCREIKTDEEAFREFHKKWKKKSRSHSQCTIACSFLSSVPTSKYYFDSKLKVLFSVIIDEVLETFNNSAPTYNNKYIYTNQPQSADYVLVN